MVAVTVKYGVYVGYNSDAGSIGDAMIAGAGVMGGINNRRASSAVFFTP
jgi:hypothetical protein